jgi:hypothetical protein
MDWNTLFPATHQPAYENIEEYIGGTGKHLWKSLFAFMENTYKAKPKMTYSVCSGKPGWNVKFQKSGQAFGTFYPEEDGFSVFFVLSYKLAPEADAAMPLLSPKMQELYKDAGDFMKMGRYMMFRIENERDFEDYKRLCAIKLKPKEL